MHDCARKKGRPFPFAELRRAQLPELRAALAVGVEECNRECYSNCAFDGAYFARYKLRLLAPGIA